ncbi:MAG: DUF6273 domain-containing protein, partial [Anaerovoracaceae bacterium]
PDYIITDAIGPVAGSTIQSSVAAKVALASYNDMNIPSRFGFGNNETRMAAPTEYSKSRGVAVAVNNNSGYWTRSPGTTAGINYITGATGTNAVVASTATNIGIRPTIKLKWSDMLFLSSAYEGKPGLITPGSLIAESKKLYPGQPKKITVKTTAINPPVMNNVAGTANVNPGTGTAVARDSLVNVTYSHTATENRGNSMFLSVLLVDTNNLIKYYGPIAKLSSGMEQVAGATASFKVPDEAGLTAKFIIEQINGNYKTDFSNSQNAPVLQGTGSFDEWKVPVRVDLKNSKMADPNPKLNAQFSTRIVPNPGYSYPAFVRIKNNNVDVPTSDSTWQYDSTEGILVLFAPLLTNSAHLTLSGSAISPQTTSLTLPKENAAWDNIYYGNYPQDQLEDSKKQPLMWRLVNFDYDKDTMQIMTDMLVDNNVYNTLNNTESFIWSNSTLELFLNGRGSNQFSGKAFTDEEYKLIRLSSEEEWPVPDGDYSPAGQYPKASKIAIPSMNDLILVGRTGMSGAANTAVASRGAVLTEYTRGKIMAKGGTLWPTPGMKGHYWLRSPFSNTDPTIIAYMDYGTNIITPMTSGFANYAYAGVRPTMRFNTDDIMMLSAAYQGKVGTLNTDLTPKALQKLSPGQPKKMTMKNSDIPAATISSINGSGAINPGGGIAINKGEKIEITYSHSTSVDRGKNMEFSVLLVDTLTNTIKYYGKIDSLPTDKMAVTNKKVSFMAPDEAGLTAKFFIEKKNGNYQTDFCNKENAPVVNAGGNDGKWSVPLRVDINNATVQNANPKVGETLTTRIIPEKGYVYPQNVTLKNNNVTVAQGAATYTYTSTDGTLMIHSSILTDTATLVIGGNSQASATGSFQLPQKNTSWDKVVFGNYPQAQTTVDPVQPLLWRVQNLNNGYVQLLTNQIVDVAPFGPAASGFWNTTSLTNPIAIRYFLNGQGDDQFAGLAFTDKEWDSIPMTPASEWPQPDYASSVAGQHYAIDSKVSLVSGGDLVSEAKSGIDLAAATATAAREAQTTHFAQNKITAGQAGGIKASWWTRSMGTTTAYATAVGSTGALANLAQITATGGVRPTIKLKLDQILLATATSGGKPSDIPNTGDPIPAAKKANAGQAKKLTMLSDLVGAAEFSAAEGTDSGNFNLQNPDLDPGTGFNVAAGETVTITYSQKVKIGKTVEVEAVEDPDTGEVTTTEKEVIAPIDRGEITFLSVALVDNNNRVAYYSPIKRLASGTDDIIDDTASFKTPSVNGLTAKFFVEEMNGNSATDFCNSEKAPMLGGIIQDPVFVASLSDGIENGYIEDGAMKTANSGDGLDTFIRANSGFTPPKSLLVTNNGATVLTGATTYTYYPNTGRIQFAKELMTQSNNIQISGACLALVANGLSAAYNASNWDRIVFGNYPQVKYDVRYVNKSKQPIEWRLLNTAGGNMQLLSEKVLDGMALNGVYWNSTGTKAFLDGRGATQFAGVAFNDREWSSMRQIPARELPVPDGMFKTYSAANDKTAAVKVTLPSDYDMKSNVKSGNQEVAQGVVATAHPSRVAYLTEYGASRQIKDTSTAGLPVRWMTRSYGGLQGSTTKTHRWIIYSEAGAAWAAASQYAYNAGVFGLRPSVKFSLSSVLMLSPSINGKPINLNTDGTIPSAPVMNKGLLKKMTLKSAEIAAPIISSVNSATNGTVNNVSPKNGTAVTPGEKVTVSYSHITDKARKANTYLSVALVGPDLSSNPVRDSNVLKFYSPLVKLPANANTETGTVSFNVPSTEVGEEALVAKFFVEEMNGDNQTDYCNMKNAPIFDVLLPGSNWVPSVTDALSNARLENGTPKANEDYISTIIPNEGYTYPLYIKVKKNGGDLAPSAANWSYDYTTGTVTIKATHMAEASTIMIIGVSQASVADTLAVPNSASYLTPTVSSTYWDKVIFGKYPQSQASAEIKQPLEWRVMNMTDGSIMLLTDKIIDRSSFANSAGGVYYHQSDFRNFSNGRGPTEFAGQAFSDKEWESIYEMPAAEIPVTDGGAASYNQAGENPKAAKVALLSINDAWDTYKTGWYAAASATIVPGRLGKLTAYSAAKVSGINAGADNEWALRSYAGKTGTSPYYVFYGITNTGATSYWYHNVANRGLRPYIKIRLSEIFMTNLATNGKPNGVPEDKTPVAMQAAKPNQGKKLTLRSKNLAVPEIKSISTLDGTSTNVAANAGVKLTSGETVNLDYSYNCIVGSDGKLIPRNSTTYLSVALLDSSNLIKFYSPIDKMEAGIGAVNNKHTSFKVPNLSGLKAVFFVEEQNGNSNTDYVNSVGLPTIIQPRQYSNNAANWGVGLFINDGLINATLENAYPNIATKFVTKLKPDFGFAYPTAINLTNNGAIVASGGTTWDYNYRTGVLTIQAQLLTATSNITVSGAAQPPQATSFNSPVANTRWDRVILGSYPQNQSGEFPKQPLEWRVLNMNDGNVQFISDKAIDTQVYNPSTTSPAYRWDVSWLRSYVSGRQSDQLSGRAFSDFEWKTIRNTPATEWTLPDGAWLPAGGQYQAKEDKVSLLSYNEANDLIKSGMNTAAARIATITEYARAKGGYSSNSLAGGNTSWWTRSPGSAVTAAAAITNAGAYASTAVTTANVTVRPSFKLELSKVLYTSAAVDGKPKNVSADLTKLTSTNAGQPKKLTMKIADIAAPE